MKHTVKSFIEFLEKFPEDLVIETELACLWDFPEELQEIKNGYSDEYFRELTQMKATKLYIFEGSWETGVVSDLEGKLEKKFKK